MTNKQKAKLLKSWYEVYYEFWDNDNRQWCLGLMPIYEFIWLKFYNWLYGSPMDIKYVPLDKVLFEKTESS